MTNQKSILCLALGMVIVGCGRDPYALVPVTGQIMTCEGKPAAGGTVMFTPLDSPELTGRPKNEPGKISEGVVTDDGTFTLWYGMTQGIGAPPPTESGAVSGPHRVMFRGPFTSKPKLTAFEKAEMTPDEIKDAEERYEAVKVYPQIPCSLNVLPTEVTVERHGKNHFIFELANP